MGHTPTSLAAGFALTARPGPGGPARQAARPVIPLTARPDNGGAGQMQRHRQVPSRRGGAGPDRGPEALQIAGTWPEGEGRARGKRPLPGKRRTCRVCYTPPASAASARGDVGAGRRGRIAADMTALMLPGDLAAVSSLPLVGQRAAPACRLCVAGSMASSSQPGGAEQPVLVPLLRWSSLPRSHCLRRSGQLADSCPQQGQTLSLAVSCCWRQSQRGGRGSRAPVSEPARPGEPGPGSRWPQRVAGQRGRCQRGQPGKPAL
jgi:hypothetical protein